MGDGNQAESWTSYFTSSSALLKQENSAMSSSVGAVVATRAHPTLAKRAVSETDGKLGRHGLHSAPPPNKPLPTSTLPGLGQDAAENLEVWREYLRATTKYVPSATGLVVAAAYLRDLLEDLESTHRGHTSAGQVLSPDRTGPAKGADLPPLSAQKRAGTDFASSQK